MTIDAKVFLSYAHESDEHKAQVLAFATFLRHAGIAAVLDLWSANARQDWYAWAIREMTDANFILVVASQRYRMMGDGTDPTTDHRGMRSEAALLRELVYAERATWLPKILPVVLPGHTVDQIPLFLQPHTASRFHITSFDTGGAEELLRVLLRQPSHIAPEVAATQPTLPPHPNEPNRHTPDPVRTPELAERPRVVNQVNNSRTGTVVQADTITGDINL